MAGLLSRVFTKGSSKDAQAKKEAEKEKARQEAIMVQAFFDQTKCGQGLKSAWNRIKVMPPRPGSPKASDSPAAASRPAPQSPAGAATLSGATLSGFEANDEFERVLVQMFADEETRGVLPTTIMEVLVGRLHAFADRHVWHFGCLLSALSALNAVCVIRDNSRCAFECGAAAAVSHAISSLTVNIEKCILTEASSAGTSSGGAGSPSPQSPDGDSTPSVQTRKRGWSAKRGDRDDLPEPPKSPIEGSATDPETATNALAVAILIARQRLDDARLGDSGSEAIVGRQFATESDLGKACLKALSTLAESCDHANLEPLTSDSLRLLCEVLGFCARHDDGWLAGQPETFAAVQRNLFRFVSAWDPQDQALLPTHERLLTNAASVLRLLGELLHQYPHLTLKQLRHFALCGTMGEVFIAIGSRFEAADPTPTEREVFGEGMENLLLSVHPDPQRRAAPDAAPPPAIVTLSPEPSVMALFASLAFLFDKSLTIRVALDEQKQKAAARNVVMATYQEDLETIQQLDRTLLTPFTPPETAIVRRRSALHLFLASRLLMLLPSTRHRSETVKVQVLDDLIASGLYSCVLHEKRFEFFWLDIRLRHCVAHVLRTMVVHVRTTSNDAEVGALFATIMSAEDLSRRMPLLCALLVAGIEENTTATLRSVVSTSGLPTLVASIDKLQKRAQSPSPIRDGSSPPEEPLSEAEVANNVQSRTPPARAFGSREEELSACDEAMLWVTSAVRLLSDHQYVQENILTLSPAIVVHLMSIRHPLVREVAQGVAISILMYDVDDEEVYRAHMAAFTVAIWDAVTTVAPAGDEELLFLILGAIRVALQQCAEQSNTFTHERRLQSVLTDPEVVPECFVALVTKLQDKWTMYSPETICGEVLQTITSMVRGNPAVRQNMFAAVSATALVESALIGITHSPNRAIIDHLLGLVFEKVSMASIAGGLMSPSTLAIKPQVNKSFDMLEDAPHKDAIGMSPPSPSPEMSPSFAIEAALGAGVGTLAIQNEHLITPLLKSFAKEPMSAFPEYLKHVLESISRAFAASRQSLWVGCSTAVFDALIELLPVVPQELLPSLQNPLELLAAHHIAARQLKKLLLCLSNGDNDHRSRLLPTVIAVLTGAARSCTKHFNEPRQYLTFKARSGHAGLRVQVRQSVTEGDGYTLALWLRSDEISLAKSGRNRVTIVSVQSSNDRCAFELCMTPTELIVRTRDDKSSASNHMQEVSLSAPLVPQRWQHVVLTHRSPTLLARAELRLFINGDEMCATSKPQYPKLSGGVLYIGTNAEDIQTETTSHTFYGQVNALYLLKAPLTAHHIRMLYLLGCHRSTALVLRDASNCPPHCRPLIEGPVADEVVVCVDPRVAHGGRLYNMAELGRSSGDDRNTVEPLEATDICESTSILDCAMSVGATETVIMPLLTLLINPTLPFGQNFPLVDSELPTVFNEEASDRALQSLLRLVQSLATLPVVRVELRRNGVFAMVATALNRLAPVVTSDVPHRLAAICNTLSDSEEEATDAFNIWFLSPSQWVTCSVDVQVEVYSTLAAMVAAQERAHVLDLLRKLGVANFATTQIVRCYTSDTQDDFRLRQAVFQLLGCVVVPPLRPSDAEALVSLALYAGVCSSTVALELLMSLRAFIRSLPPTMVELLGKEGYLAVITPLLGHRDEEIRIEAAKHLVLLVTGSKVAVQQLHPAADDGTLGILLPEVASIESASVDFVADKLKQYPFTPNTYLALREGLLGSHSTPKQDSTSNSPATPAKTPSKARRRRGTPASPVKSSAIFGPPPTSPVFSTRDRDAEENRGPLKPGDAEIKLPIVLRPILTLAKDAPASMRRWVLGDIFALLSSHPNAWRELVSIQGWQIAVCDVMMCGEAGSPPTSPPPSPQATVDDAARAKHDDPNGDDPKLDESAGESGVSTPTALVSSTEGPQADTEAAVQEGVSLLVSVLTSMVADPAADGVQELHAIVGYLDTVRNDRRTRAIINMVLHGLVAALLRRFSLSVHEAPTPRQILQVCGVLNCVEDELFYCQSVKMDMETPATKRSSGLGESSSSRNSSFSRTHSNSRPSTTGVSSSEEGVSAWDDFDDASLFRYVEEDELFMVPHGTSTGVSATGVLSWGAFPHDAAESYRGSLKAGELLTGRWFHMELATMAMQLIASTAAFVNHSPKEGGTRGRSASVAQLNTAVSGGTASAGVTEETSRMVRDGGLQRLFLRLARVTMDKSANSSSTQEQVLKHVREFQELVHRTPAASFFQRRAGKGMSASSSLKATMQLIFLCSDTVLERRRRGEQSGSNNSPNRSRGTMGGGPSGSLGRAAFMDNILLERIKFAISTHWEEFVDTKLIAPVSSKEKKREADSVHSRGTGNMPIAIAMQTDSFEWLRNPVMQDITAFVEVIATRPDYQAFVQQCGAVVEHSKRVDRTVAELVVLSHQVLRGSVHTVVTDLSLLRNSVASYLDDYVHEFHADHQDVFLVSQMQTEMTISNTLLQRHWTQFLKRCMGTIWFTESMRKSAASIHFTRLNRVEQRRLVRLKVIPDPSGTTHAGLTAAGVREASPQRSKVKNVKKGEYGSAATDAADADADAQTANQLSPEDDAGDQSLSAMSPGPTRASGGDDELQGMSPGDDTEFEVTAETEEATGNRATRLEVPCELVHMMQCWSGKFGIFGEYFGVTVDDENTSYNQFVAKDAAQFVKKPRNQTFSIADITEISPARRYRMIRTAVEFRFSDGGSILTNFASREDMDLVLRTLKRSPLDIRRFTMLSDSPKKELSRHQLTRRWRNREISNFDYLLGLNYLAGRTQNDFTQYPVFPWVLQDYTSEKLDLHDEDTYRDMRLPVGLLGSASRREEVEMRYNEMLQMQDIPFHFFTHYSSPAVALYFMVRMEPFTTSQLVLQGGHFDHPDRMFHSLPACFRGVTQNIQDVKELIPELFCFPEMLMNSNNVEFGQKQDKAIMDDVVLPPWAGTGPMAPFRFVQKMREALESEVVSASLHHWVDLVFGYKQRGTAAVSACNLFHPHTYEPTKPVAMDPQQRQEVIDSLDNIGQTPIQLFTKKHPERRRDELMHPVLHQAVGARKENYSWAFEGIAAIKFTSNDRLILVGTNGAAVVTRIVQTPVLLRPGGTPQSAKGRLDDVITRFRTHAFAFDVAQDYEARSGPLKRGLIPEDTSAENAAEAVVDPDRETPNHPGTSTNTAILSFGGSLAFSVHAGVFDGCCLVRNLYTGRDDLRLTAHSGKVVCLAATADSGFLATGSLDTSFLVWRMAVKNRRLSAKVLFGIYGHEDSPTGVAICNVVDLVVSAARDGSVFYHALRTGNLEKIVHHPNGHFVDNILIQSTAYVPSVLLCSSRDNTVHQFSLNGTPMHSIELRARLVNWSLTADPTIFATVTEPFVTSDEEEMKTPIAYRSALDLTTMYRPKISGVPMGEVAATNEAPPLAVFASHGSSSQIMAAGDSEGHLWLIGAQAPLPPSGQ